MCSLKETIMVLAQFYVIYLSLYLFKLIFYICYFYVQFIFLKYKEPLLIQDILQSTYTHIPCILPPRPCPIKTLRKYLMLSAVQLPDSGLSNQSSGLNTIICGWGWCHQPCVHFKTIWYRAYRDFGLSGFNSATWQQGGMGNVSISGLDGTLKERSEFL